MMQIVITVLEQCSICRLHRATPESYKECKHEHCPVRHMLLLNEEQDRLDRSRNPNLNTRGEAGFH